jgi:hypothetical protein
MDRSAKGLEAADETTCWAILKNSERQLPVRPTADSETANGYAINNVKNNSAELLK